MITIYKLTFLKIFIFIIKIYFKAHPLKYLYKKSIYLNLIK